MLFKRLDANSQKELLCEIVERVIVDVSGKVIRVGLLPPFSYLRQLSDRMVSEKGKDGARKQKPVITLV